LAKLRAAVSESERAAPLTRGGAVTLAPVKTNAPPEDAGAPVSADAGTPVSADAGAPVSAATGGARAAPATGAAEPSFADSRARLLGGARGARGLEPKTDAAARAERRAAQRAMRAWLCDALGGLAASRAQLAADAGALASTASSHAALGGAFSVGGRLARAHAERGRRDAADVTRAVGVLVAVAALVVVQRVAWGVFWVRLALPSLADVVSAVRALRLW
jgi:hypothetical protein